MTTVSVAIFVLWGGSILAAATALGVMIRRGLWHHYPFLAMYLVTNVLRSVLRVQAYIAGGAAGYQVRWLNSEAFEVFFLSAIVIEGYVIRAKELNSRFWKAGIVFMALFVVVALLAIWSTSSLGVLPNSSSPTMILLSRYFQSACLVTVLLYRAFFRSIYLQSKRNAVRYGASLSIMLVGSSAGYLMMQWNTYTTNAVTQFILLGSQIWAYLGWARMDIAGEEPGPRPPVLTEEEMRRNQEEWDRINRRISELRRQRTREIIDRLLGRRR